MGINLFEVNGKHPQVDYELLKSSFIDQFSRTCKNASIYVMNRFPVLVSSDTDIDLILIVVVDEQRGNYISIRKNDRNVYVHNLIMPIKLVSNHYNSKIEKDEKNILADGAELDYLAEINALKFNLKYYINNRCGINEEVYIHPFVFLKNRDFFSASKDILISQDLNFAIINEWWKKNNNEIFISRKKWKDYGAIVNEDLQKIIDQASNDSELGYLTKKKIEKIGSDLSKQSNLVKYLGKELIEIKGKAGSGKTTELLTLCINALKADYNPFFLTYNRLLVYDISQLIKGIVNRKEINGFATVTTLHKFFKDLSTKLGVLHIMSEDRQSSILINLRKRLRSSYDIISEKIIFSGDTNFEAIKTIIQNSGLDNGTIEVGIDFINFLKKKKKINSKKALKNYSIEFFESKTKKLSDLDARRIFLADYYGVLENVIKTIQNPEKFYSENNLSSKFELLNLATGIGKTYTNEDGEIELKKFKEFNNRRIGSRRGKKRLVFIDEAQDCYYLEKEILASIYGHESIVIANGGKEQLIRHVELCNWGVIAAKKIKAQIKNKRNQSYRVKPEIADFCNYFGLHYGIDLQLESVNTPDKGGIIFDFRKNISQEGVNEVFDHLIQKGKIHGCLEYESLLVLLNTLGSNTDSIMSENEYSSVNEYGNVNSSIAFNRGKWDKLEGLEKIGYQFFDGTVNDKSKLNLPYPNEIRLLFYESCRGLEGWSVACFDLDKFFEAKQKEEDAEKFLIDDEKGKNVQNMFITNEERQKMYAATWVLMALTRVIDTLYISIKNENSEFGKIVKAYIDQNPHNVRVLK